MINKEVSSFQSGALKIAYDIYTNNNNNGILICIAHGMVEHRGKYTYIATKLAENGFIVGINDHRGHGDSIDNINDNIYLGEMGKDGFEKAVDDIHAFYLILKNRFKPSKFILIGHSMGSLISRRYLQKYESSLDLLILCGTPSPQKTINFGIKILEVLKYIKMEKVAQSIAHNMSFIAFNSKYKNDDDLNNGNPSGVMWINRDRDELIKHIRDNKCNFIFTTNSFINLLRGLKKVFSKYENKINKQTMPILFISGEDDACGNFSKGALEAFKHLHKQGYKNVKLILYAGARHELFLEINKDEVINDVIAWIKYQS